LICCALTAPRPRRWPLLSSLASVDLNITRLQGLSINVKLGLAEVREVLT
jgi:hypothetical protein